MARTDKCGTGDPDQGVVDIAATVRECVWLRLLEGVRGPDPATTVRLLLLSEQMGERS